MKKNPVDKLIDAGGGARPLADRLEVTRQAIYLWRSKGYVPNGRLRQIERIYGIPPRQLANPKLVKILDDGDAEDLI